MKEWVVTDAQALALVIVLLYLSECVWWVRRGSVVMRSTPRGGYAIVHPSGSFGNASGGLVLLNPLTPFGDAFVCHQWPVTVTADLACSYVGQAINFAERREQDARVVLLDEVEAVGDGGHDVSLNGSRFLAAGDGPRAVAELIRQLAAARGPERAPLIDDTLADWTDAAAAAARYRQYRSATRTLRLHCTALLVLLVLAVPLCLLVGPLRVGIPYVLACAAAAWAACVWLSHRAHRTLYPAETAARWRMLATMCFAPTAAVRACHALSRDALARHDPLAAAVALCGEPSLDAFARRVVLDLRYPLLPVLPPALAAQPEVRAAESWFRGRLGLHVAGVLARSGRCPETYADLPPASEPAHRSYCPRCRLQYVVADGHCADCGGRQLLPLLPTTHESRE